MKWYGDMILSNKTMRKWYKDSVFIANIGIIRVIYIVDDAYLLDNIGTFKKEKHDIY